MFSSQRIRLPRLCEYRSQMIGHEDDICSVEEVINPHKELCGAICVLLSLHWLLVITVALCRH